MPQEFGHYVTILYESIGSPTVDSESDCEILQWFKHLDNAVNFLEECQVYLNILDDEQVNLDDEVMVPPPGIELYGGLDHQDADSNYYMRGVDNGCGLGMWIITLSSSKLKVKVMVAVNVIC